MCCRVSVCAGDRQVVERQGPLWTGTGVDFQELPVVLPGSTTTVSYRFLEVPVPVPRTSTSMNT